MEITFPAWYNQFRSLLFFSETKAHFFYKKIISCILKVYDSSSKLHPPELPVTTAFFIK